MTSRKTKTYIIISLLLLAVLLPMILLPNIQNDTYREGLVAVNTNVVQNNNIQEYTINENTGEKRTIYWAKGIDAPKMASDKELETAQGRYFKRKSEIISGKEYVSYRYKMEVDKGYYDFNKNSEDVDIFPQQVAHHCYLASAMNQIYWWFDQNKYYIDKYRTLIEQGVFDQRKDLHPINDALMWDSYLEKPQLLPQNPSSPYYSTDLSDNIMYKKVFNAYRNRDVGYYPDLVWDNFFNGYKAIADGESSDGVVGPNTDGSWKPSKDGGFFYNLFGEKRLTRRLSVGSYELFSEVIKENLLAGNGINMSFQSAGPAHAITLWGAEYDEKGLIKRVYLTDSDDFGSDYIVEDGVVMGLHSNEIAVDKNGFPRLTELQNAQTGGLILELFTLSLGQDRLEEALNDIEDPIAPKFETNIYDNGFTAESDDPRTLEVKVKREDKGTYSYQWYESDDSTSMGKKIPGATKAWYTPPVPKTGTEKYYYCEVSNLKNGKYATSVSNRAKLYIDPTVTHAKAPIIKEGGNSSFYQYKQYEMPRAIIVNGNSPDNGIITYQWYHRVNGVTEKLEGETSNYFYPNNVALYEPNQATPEDPDGDGTVVSHYYYCEVKNTNNTVSGRKSETKNSKTYEVFVVPNPKGFVKAMTPIIRENTPTLIEEDLLGEIAPITVSAKSLDSGELEYKWYMANSMDASGVEIKGANTATYQPKKADGNKYYYCEIINVNNKANNVNSDKVTTNRTQVITTTQVSTDNNLYELTTTKGTLSPEFKYDVLDYTLQLAYEEDSTVLSAVYSPLANVTGLGKVSVAAGQSKKVNIVVTAESGASKTYTVTINRKQASNNAYLSNITTTQGQLTPTFNKEILSYKIELGKDITGTTIGATVEHEKAVVSGLGEVLVNQGETKQVSIVVTAESGVSKTYIVTVSREQASNNASLSNITTTQGQLTPTFNKETLSYKIELGKDVIGTTIGATAEHEKAFVSGLGEVLVNQGETKQISIVVTAEDGITKKTYTIAITREKEEEVTPDPDTKPDPDVKPNPEPEPEPDPDVKPEPEPEPDPDPEVNPTPDPETKPTPKPEVKPEGTNIDAIIGWASAGGVVLFIVGIVVAIIIVNKRK